MIFKYLDGKEMESFSDKWNKLREQDRIRTIEDNETIVAFWEKNPAIHFEAARAEVEIGTAIGMFCVDGNKFFTIATKDQKILLFDKLSKFLRIK